MNSELSMLLKATIVLLSAGVVSATMRRTSASARHVLWVFALVAALAVPVASTLLPSIDLPLLAPQSVETPALEAASSPSLEVSYIPVAAPTSVITHSSSTSPPLPGTAKTWKTWLRLAWGMGSVAVAIGWLAAVWNLRRLKRRSTPLVDTEWRTLLNEVERDFSVAGVQLQISSDAIPPMTWGIFRPVILLPATAKNWGSTRRRLVLAHEMAHVKRNDGLGQVLAQIACSIYWFNPAVWYAVHRLYVERERACDDAVLRLGAPAADYADHLLQIARGMNAKFALTAVSMAHPSELKSRITAILEAGIRRQRASHIAVATLLTLIVGLGLFVAALQITTLAAMTLPTVASRGAIPAPVFYKPAVLAQTPTTATGTKVEGVIVKLGTNEGVADAGVELSPVSSTAKPVVVAAGRDGRFTFDNVAPGEYRLAAARPGFVRAELGQRVASGNGRIISVKADQSTTNLKIELIETGSISGTIRSRNGTPLENVQVQALRYSYKDGRRVLITVRSITTNDLGEYRLFWLPPGDYLVLATLLDVSRSQRLIETRPDGSTAMRMIGPSAGEAILLPNDDASVPFYFPGVTDPLMAEPLTIQSGTNRNSVNINIASLGTRRVRGIVLNLPAPSSNPGDPFPPAPRMRLHPTNVSVADESAPYGLTPFDRTTGVFEVRGVLPGSYDVIASFGNFHGRTTIQIGSADLDNVRVALLPDFEINMQVKIENAPPNTDVSKLQARLDPDYSGPARRQPSGMWQWRPAWAATPYRVSVDQLPENTYLKSARLGDLDLLTTPMRFDRSPGDPVEIVLGLGSTISGTIANTTLEPGTTALVALIPDEARRGRSDLYKSVQTDTQGRFRFAGVAPGDYVLLAWENVEEGAWRYPDFIRRYEDRAKTIHVDENSNPTIQLSVIP